MRSIISLALLAGALLVIAPRSASSLPMDTAGASVATHVAGKSLAQEARHRWRGYYGGYRGYYGGYRGYYGGYYRPRYYRPYYQPYYSYYQPYYYPYYRPYYRPYYYGSVGPNYYGSFYYRRPGIGIYLSY